MSTSILLLLLSPFLVLITVFGLVVIVALFRARPEDIPAVLRECSDVFWRLADRLPHPRGGRGTPGRRARREKNALEGLHTEEAQ